MQLTVQIKLIPSKMEQGLLRDALYAYILTVNSIVSDFVNLDKADKRTSADITALMPSALKNQAIQDARSVFKKYKKELFKQSKKVEPKTVKVPVLKKPVAIWNNQNFSIGEDFIAFPLWMNGKAKKTAIKAIIPEKQKTLLQGTLGSLRITKKQGKYVAQIAVEVPCESESGMHTMGVDLGLKVPAVAMTDTGKIQFFGNGRENKYKKRQARLKRKQLGKSKNLKSLKKLNNKEQRWMKDKDHKVSRQIINFAKDNKVSTIQLEALSGIRQTARTSRKNNYSLHSWSFYRLTQFIQYKAELAGIKVVFVDPKYTSQTCPVCGTRNKANDRKYKCPCGFETHRDILGARNIITAPVIGGNSLSA